MYFVLKRRFYGSFYIMRNRKYIVFSKLDDLNDFTFITELLRCQYNTEKLTTNNLLYQDN